jgi:hypothetical protein
MNEQMAPKTSPAATDGDMAGSKALPDGSGHIDLCKRADDTIFLIVCRDLDGSLRWQVLPPEGKSDTWEAVDVQSDAVVGNSTSGWRVAIDSASGNEMTRRPHGI